MTAPLLQVTDLVRHYDLPREKLFGPPPTVKALNGVSFTVQPGRSLGIVGESGSGKSTIARLVMALDRPDFRQRSKLEGRDLHALPRAELRAARRDVQMVFQDPYGSLDPRQTVAGIVAEPLEALAETSRAEQRERAAESLAAVGLRASDLAKYPHEFSGGQRQRIAIARALITRPTLIVADEPVSALVVSVQAQVLNLMPTGPAAAVRHQLPAHQPRPGGGQPPVRRGLRAVPRPGGGARRAAATVRPCRASVHAGPAGGRAARRAGRS